VLSAEGTSEAGSSRPLGSVRYAEDHTAKDARSARSGGGSRSPYPPSAESCWRRSRTCAQYTVRIESAHSLQAEPLTNPVHRGCRLIILATNQPFGIRVARRILPSLDSEEFFLPSTRELPLDMGRR